MDNNKYFYKTAVGVGAGSLIFAFVIFVIMASDYIKIKSLTPLNSPAVAALLEKLDRNPEDEALKNQIQALDFMSRRLFFTNKRQLETGGKLLLVFISLFLISAKTAIFFKTGRDNQKAGVQISGDDKDPFQLNRKARNYCIILGLTLGGATILFYFSNAMELAAVKPLDKPGEKSVAKGGETLNENDILNNWLNFRGPYGAGKAHNASPPETWDGKTGEGIVWKTEIALPGFNSPVIVREKIFLSGADKNERAVFCFDFNTGELLWRAKTRDFIKADLKIPKVFKETGFAAPGLAADNKNVYAVFATGELIAFSHSGEHAWSKYLGMPDKPYGHSSSLIIHENRLYVQNDQSSDSTLSILDTTDGAVIKTIKRPEMTSWASPVVYLSGNRPPAIILNSSPFVISYDIKTGNENWRAYCMRGDVAPSVTYYGPRIYAVNISTCLFAIDAENGKLVWESCEADLPDTSSPVATPDYVFIASSIGVISCIDARDGTILWSKEFKDGFYSSPVWVDDKIYLLDMKGKMHIFKADKTYTPISSPPLYENTVTTPGFIKDKIIIRGEKHLYCIGNKLDHG